MRSRIFLLIAIVSFSGGVAFSQNDTLALSYGGNFDTEYENAILLSLEECISTALENNYSIMISENNLEIARNNVTLAPFLPSITLSSRQSSNSQRQRNYASDGSRGDDVVKSNTIQNGASLNWRLFDGLSMFVQREKQEELLAQGEYNFKSDVEQLVMDVSSQYYTIITLHNQVQLLSEQVSISETRYNQALTRYNIGSDSGLEYKQAKIYLNSDMSRLMLQQEVLKNAYIELYRMINVPFDVKYVIRDTISIEGELQLNSLLEFADKSNTTLNAMRAGEKIAKLDTKIARAARYPTLDFSAGYNYNLNQSQYFPSKYNEINGPNWGFSLSVPIFSGNEINRRIKNAQISEENSRLSYEMVRQNITSRVRQLHNLYLNNLKLIDFEEESEDAAHLNLDAAMEKYRLGSLSGIEFRDYQMSYLEAANRKLNAIYQAKASEISLMLMSGILL